MRTRLPATGELPTDESDELPELDTAELSTVSGGATGTENQAVMTALTGILDSVKELQTPKKSGFGMTEMMMLMMMRRRRGY